MLVWSPTMVKKARGVYWYSGNKDGSISLAPAVMTSMRSSIRTLGEGRVRKSARTDCAVLLYTGRAVLSL